MKEIRAKLTCVHRYHIAVDGKWVEDKNAISLRLAITDGPATMIRRALTATINVEELVSQLPDGVKQSLREALEDAKTD